MRSIQQRINHLVLCLILGFLLALCFPISASAWQEESSKLPTDTFPMHWDWSRLPRGLVALPAYPDSEPPSAEQVSLGRRLFFDPILSRDQTVACASCHQPQHAMATNDRVAVGIDGKQGVRNSPSLLNVSYSSLFFWDGRSTSLEDQALQPIENELEMDFSVSKVLERLQAEPTYVTAFEAAFDSEPTRESLASALAAFQRTLLVGDSPVDRFRDSDFSALTTEQRNGMWLFESRAGCWRCHSGPNFSDDRFHNTGVAWASEPIDEGRFTLSGNESERGAFKTPGLRSVSRTAPYMHDGSMATLADVVRFYNEGGIKNPHLDTAMKPLNLSKEEERYLVAFLEALDSQFVFENGVSSRPGTHSSSTDEETE